MAGTLVPISGGNAAPGAHGTASVSPRGAINYLRRQRHILLDMHVPAFETSFLTNFDPVANVRLWDRAGADSVMVYCNSMTGLTNWPSKVGQMHPGLSGRDVVGETVKELHARGIAACAYYSVNYNNWAFENHPRWRIELAAPAPQFGNNSRAGICCPASQGFRDFTRTQVEEIAKSYEFDAFFFDMMYFPGVCVCDNCHDRYRAETGAEIPSRIDWFSPEWSRFQTARERWLLDQYRNLRAGVKAQRSIPVFNNSGFIFSNWTSGLSLAVTSSDDLIGGDASAGTGLFAFAHLASRLSPNGWQFMHSSSGYVSGAVKIPSETEQRGHALVATVFDGQFMMIDGVLPDGSVYAPTYDRLASVFSTMKPYERYLGGKPLADIGVYYSTDANVDFRRNGKLISDADAAEGSLERPSDHIAGVWGACEALRRVHLPVGVLTRSDLESLDHYSVIVLPNVLRLDETEVSAFRRYVERGGNLYASGYTSLVDTSGTKHADFALHDVFGCHFEGLNSALVTFLRPLRDDLRAAVAPAEYASHGSLLTGFNPIPSSATSLLVNADSDAHAIASLTLPYGEGRGNRAGGFASIFTSPPWKSTDRPLIVEHRYGAGRSIYSACDIEAPIPYQDPEQASALFVQIIRSLLKHAPVFEADAHPDVWIVAFAEPAQRRIRVNLLNHQQGEPLPVPNIRLFLSPPAGAKFNSLRVLPSGRALNFQTTADGRLLAHLSVLNSFEMLSAEY